MAGERMVSLMQNISKASNSSPTNTDLVFGEVVSLSPLQIKVDNRFIIDEDFIILSNLCIRKTMTIPERNIINSLGETLDSLAPEIEIEVWRGLEVGDHVRMLRVNAGQQYYVIERSNSL